MGSGTGTSFIDSAINQVLNTSTLGYANFSEDGVGTTNVGDNIFGLTAPIEHGVGDLKEVTGAKAAEEANAESRKRFEEERAASAKQRADNIAQSAANELIKSRSAASARGGVSGSSKGQSRFSDIGSDEQDFLGL